MGFSRYLLCHNTDIKTSGGLLPDQPFYETPLIDCFRHVIIVNVKLWISTNFTIRNKAFIHIIELKLFFQKCRKIVVKTHVNNTLAHVRFNNYTRYHVNLLQKARKLSESIHALFEEYNY